MPRRLRESEKAETLQERSDEAAQRSPAASEAVFAEYPIQNLSKRICVNYNQN